MDAKFVDAIEEGRIVRVSEDYAKKEHLIILRKAAEPEKAAAVKKGKEPEERIGFDELRKPLNWWKSNKVVEELVENFQWEISKRRRSKGMTRKQMADTLKVSENELKLLENGMLPSDDFVLVNKVESFLGVNLRKKKQDESARALVEKKEAKSEGPRWANPKRADEGKISGSDIEIID